MRRLIETACLAIVCALFTVCAAGEGAAPSANGEVASALPAAAIPPQIPAATFADVATLADPILAPNGARFIGRALVKGTEELVIHDLGSGKTTYVERPKQADIRWYRWAGNDRIVASFIWTIKWRSGEYQATRLFLYDLAAGRVQLLGREEGAFEGDDVLYVDPSGDWLLLSLQRALIDWPAVYRVDLATGEMTEACEACEAHEHVYEWFADRAGVVRLGLGYGEKFFVIYRSKDSDRFHILRNNADWIEMLEDITPIRDSDDVYALSSHGTGRKALYRYNYATGEEAELVYECPTADIEYFALTEDGKSVEYVTYTDDSHRIVWLSPAMKQHHDDISAQLPNKTTSIESWDSSRSRLLVHSGGASDPGAYYVYTSASRKLAQLARINPRLDPGQLATPTYTEYQARDGTTIAAYLTLPVGREPKALPLIILPHGGPYGIRDVLEYNPEVQLLANRGYAVLQPNFRGSGGYGEDFERKGNGQMGRQMQDDLDDGMDWLVKSGTVDPQRVCMVGASYGGYAALWGATRNPERYRCAASLAGVTDLRQQLNYSDDFFMTSKNRRQWRERVQGPKGFDLESVSPLQQTSKLKVPILITHGTQDRTVPFKQAKSYVDKLAKEKKTFEFYEYKNEGHGLRSAANRADWFERLEAFLEKHNPSSGAVAAP